MPLTRRQHAIIRILTNQAGASISVIKAHLGEEISTSTLNRDLAALVAAHCLVKTGKGRATAYHIAPGYKLFAPFELSDYFDLDPDVRQAQTGFNAVILELLQAVQLFTDAEQEALAQLKQEYQNNIADYPAVLFQKELERLSIELSWKSAQIEGNTYSLLETERLFKEKEQAQGKPREDAIMLLNHKDALDYVLAHPGIAKQIDVRLVEEIHALLIKELGVGRNIRTRTVGITGTAYKPLDNIYQIKEAMEHFCTIINARNNGFEKALLGVVLIAYIQPFEDGNKRTARMLSNALLIEEGLCPLSYRSVDSIDYKKAMLLFYEQNNLTAFKQIFMQQIEFSVKNYFR